MAKIWQVFILLLLGGILGGCVGVNNLVANSAEETTPAKSIATTPKGESEIVVPDLVPSVDLTQHSVPLDEIYFDTFRPTNRALPLSQASADMIEQLRDAIPPIHAPKYEPAAEADWLRAEDGVIGYAVGDEAWAYPLRILNFHEIVNDHLGGEPVLISFCPLCYSGVVYSRQLDDGTILTFGNTSALYESDMVMLDYESGSYWWQVAGRAIVGERTGAQLPVLPSSTTTWAEWQARYPHTLVLSRDTGHARDYSYDPFQGIDAYFNAGRFAFPVSDAALDERLQAGDKVLAIQVGDLVKVYPLNLDRLTVVMDKIDGEEVVLYLDPESTSGGAFSPLVDGERLTFFAQGGRIVDAETSSSWDLAGRAIDGALEGQQLRQLPTKTSFWFSIIAAEPDLLLWGD